MIAPVAFENLSFPDQRNLDWSDFESIEWMRAGRDYFTTDNGVTYGTPVQVGSDLPSSVAMYAGGALAQDGTIYALGHLADDILKIDTYTDTITSQSYSPVDPSSNACAYSPFTNCVYFDSDNGIVKYDVSAGTYSATSYPYSGQGTIVGFSHDGRYMYFNGFYSSRKMYYYDILSDTITDTGTSWSGDRLTGCLSWNNKFFMGGGGGSNDFIMYDPVANSATTFSSAAADQYRNFIQYFDGYMYTFGGYGSNLIKRVDPVTLDVVNVYTMPSTTYNWNDYVIGADGKIYCVGASSTLGIFDPRDNTFSTATLPGTNNEGIVMGAQGDLYVMPWSTNKISKVPIQNNGRVITELQTWNYNTCRHHAT